MITKALNRLSIPLRKAVLRNNQKPVRACNVTLGYVRPRSLPHGFCGPQPEVARVFTLSAFRATTPVRCVESLHYPSTISNLDVVLGKPGKCSPRLVVGTDLCDSSDSP